MLKIKATKPTPGHRISSGSASACAQGGISADASSKAEEAQKLMRLCIVVFFRGLTFAARDF